MDKRIQWLSTIDEATAQAKGSGKLVLLDFFKPT